jgi:hypothetical protein
VAIIVVTAWKSLDNDAIEEVWVKSVGTVGKMLAGYLMSGFSFVQVLKILRILKEPSLRLR